MTTLLTVLTAIALVVPPNSAIAFSARDIARTARQVTVRIVSDTASGSGVIVKQEGNIHWVLTCAHVISSPREDYEIRTTNGDRYEAETDNIETLNNINLAVIPFESDRSYSVANRGNFNSLATGDTIYAAGFPVPENLRDRDRDEFQFTNGIISSLLVPPREGGYDFTHTSLTYTGMGGAPIFDSNGLLIGIHCGGDRQSENLDLRTGFNWGISIDRLSEIAGFEVEHREEDPFTRISPAPMPYFPSSPDDRPNW